MKNGDSSSFVRGKKKLTTALGFSILEHRDRSARRITWARTLLVCLAAIVPACTSLLLSQTLRYLKPPDAKKGEVLYKNGCIACHGSTGKGAPQTTIEFELPDTFPDFTRCDQTTAETNLAYKAVVVHGGPSRGLSQIMPAFGELLTSEQIDDVLAYMREFCTDKRWPRGELNLPRALVTEKAYPEDEVVISTAMNVTGAPGLTTDIIHEQRFGINNQIEIDVPINSQDQNHSWNSGLGDITFAVKRVMFSSLRTGSILALQGGVLAPTGNSKYGFTNGTTTFEPFAAFDQLFPTNTFLQFQLGADLPHRTDITPQSLFWRAAIGQTLAGDHRLGRLWSPMVEFLAVRDLKDGAKTNWDVLPEMQVTISARQHVRFDLGVRTPMTNTAGRDKQLVFYLLWDWADGKLWEGWK
jgi:mono/diheme cytochrome c family protein